MRSESLSALNMEPAILVRCKDAAGPRFALRKPLHPCLSMGSFPQYVQTLPAAGIGKNPWAEHIRHGWIRQTAIVQHRKGLSDGRVPWLTPCNVDRRADTD